MNTRMLLSEGIANASSPSHDVLANRALIRVCFTGACDRGHQGLAPSLAIAYRPYFDGNCSTRPGRSRACPTHIRSCLSCFRATRHQISLPKVRRCFLSFAGLSETDPLLPFMSALAAFVTVLGGCASSRSIPRSKGWFRP